MVAAKCWYLIEALSHKCLTKAIYKKLSMIKPLIALILFCHICLIQASADDVNKSVDTVDDLNEPQTNAAEINAVLELKKLLEPLSSVSADFQQQLYSADDYQIQDNRGHMQVSAPGKIRWIIDSPMEQWLISDGLTLWLYDPDLEQVIIKPFDPRVSAAPALLLTGSVSELSTMFQVSEPSLNESVLNGSGLTEADIDSEQASNKRRFKLIPRDNETLYEYLMFDFDGPKPAEIVIVDSLGQRTRIIFSKVVLNEQVDPKLYSFEPPPGIDIILDK